MEGVPADRRPGGFEGRCGVGAAHVHRHRLDPLAAFRAEKSIEAPKGGGALAFPNPEGRAGGLVDDNGEELVAFRVGDLVDTEAGEMVEAGVGEFLGDNPADDRCDGLPVDPQRRSDGGPVTALSPPCNKLLERDGVARTGSGPRHILGHHPAAHPA